MSNNDILIIAFFANEVPWAYKIINKMDDCQKAIYSNSPMPEIVRSISRKLSIIRNIADNINLEMREINKILVNNKNVDQCIQTGHAFLFQDIHLIYKVLMYMEAFISTMKSCKDFLIKYIVIFNRTIIRDKTTLVQSKDPRGKPRGIRSAASRPAAQALALVRDDA